MSSVLNFSAGPGVLPKPVLEQAQSELVDWHGTGLSVMEMSHRSKAYESIIADAEAGAREFLNIPSDYAVLFLQGGASLQFTMLAKNFLKGSADYVTTGAWGQKAIESARLEGAAHEVFSDKANGFKSAPNLASLTWTEGADYRHFCMNETIQGVDYLADPTEKADWICDMSSCIGSRPMDYSRYAMVYAGAQKNLGPAGATLVVLRPDMLERVPSGLPSMLDYSVQAKNGSMFNTPPCYTIYMLGLVFRHCLKLGGIEAITKINEEKAAVLYDAIDGSGGFYRGHAVKENRSRMNVSFVLANDELTKPFLAQAAAQGMLELNGHRSVGGCRASIYNAMPKSAVETLVAFMKDFQAKNG